MVLCGYLVMVMKEIGRMAFPDIYLYLISNDLIFCKVLCILKVVVKSSERLNLDKHMEVEILFKVVVVEDSILRIHRYLRNLEHCNY